MLIYITFDLCASTCIYFYIYLIASEHWGIFTPIFFFKDKNGVLLIHPIITRIKRKCILKDSKSEEIYNAIESVTLIKRTQNIEEGINVLGAVKEELLSPKEQNALEKFIGCAPFQVSVKSFNRIEFESFIIYGQNYPRMTKRDNSTIEYKSERNNRFGQVQFLIFLRK